MKKIDTDIQVLIWTLINLFLVNFLIINALPSVGLFLFFINGLVFLYINKREAVSINKFAIITYLILSISFLFRSNIQLIISTSILQVYLYSYLVVKNDNSQLNFNALRYMLLPIIAITNLLIDKNTHDETSNLTKPAKQSLIYRFTSPNISKNSIGIIITILISLLIIPILATTNDTFYNWVNIVFNLNFTTLFFFKLILFIILEILFYRLYVRLNSKPFSFVDSPDDRINYVIPKVTIAIILIFYIVSQISVYLNLENISNSAQTRSIFTQLLFVSAIIFVIFYFDRIKKALTTKVNMILLFLIVLILGFALNSDVSYIINSGLTYKRILGLFFIIIIVAGYTVTYRGYLKNESIYIITKKLFFLITSLFVILNLINIDYLIKKYTPRINNNNPDYRYLSLNLNADMYPADLFINQQFHVNKDVKDIYDPESIIAKFYISELSDKYNNFDIRFFNLPEYVLYKKLLNSGIIQQKQTQ